MAAVVPEPECEPTEQDERGDEDKQFHWHVLSHLMARSVDSQFSQSGLDRLVGTLSDGVGPLHRRLANALRLAIACGEVAVGQSLPAERTLARQLAVSRATVVAAYELLREEQLLERRQGSGTRVRSTPTPAQPVGRLNGALNRNTIFRRLTDGPDGTIDLTGAYLLEPGTLPEDAAR